MNKYGYNKIQLRLIEEYEKSKLLNAYLSEKNSELYNSKCLIDSLNIELEKLTDTLNQKTSEEVLLKQDILDSVTKLEILEAKYMSLSKEYNNYKESVSKVDYLKIVSELQDKLESCNADYNSLKQKYQNKIQECDSKCLQVDSLTESKCNFERKVTMLEDILESKNEEIKMVHNQISKLKQECLDLTKKNYELESSSTLTPVAIISSNFKGVKKIRKSIK